MKRAILLSGGQDSASLAWWKRPQVAIFIDYGQLSAGAERRAAGAIASELGIEIEQVTLDCTRLGAGQMAGAEQISVGSTPEWWPFRNQLLVTVAAAVCVRRGVVELMIGTVADDFRHGDGSTAFVKTLDALLSMQEGHLHLTAPAITMSSEDLMRISRIPASAVA